MSKIKTCWETQFNVSSAEADMHSRIRLGSLSNILIQSAIQHADHLGFGFGDLSKNELFWVLSRLYLEIEHTIEWGEEVYVETWPKSSKGPMYLRDFILKDKQGSILANATSAWLAIDINSKRPSLIEGPMAAHFEEHASKHAIPIIPGKLDCLENTDDREISPQYFDLDLNKHVTATRYMDWAMDMLSLDFHRSNYPKTVQVNYLKETLPGEGLLYKKKELEQGTFAFEVLNTSQNKLAAQLKIAF